MAYYCEVVRDVRYLAGLFINKGERDSKLLKTLQDNEFKEESPIPFVLEKIGDIYLNEGDEIHELVLDLRRLISSL